MATAKVVNDFGSMRFAEAAHAEPVKALVAESSIAANQDADSDELSSEDRFD